MNNIIASLIPSGGIVFILGLNKELIPFEA